MFKAHGLLYHPTLGSRVIKISPSAVLDARAMNPVSHSTLRGWLRVEGERFREHSSGLRVQGSGYRGEGSGFRGTGAVRVQGLRCRVQARI